MSRVVFVDDFAPLGVDRGSARRHVARRPCARPPVGDWLDRARQAVDEGNYHVASFAAGRAVDEQGETAEVLCVLARAHAGLGRADDAVVAARRAVRLAPRDADSLLTLARIFEDLGNWDAALACYRAAERFEPTRARLGIASVWLRTGQVAEARRIAEELCSHGAVVCDETALLLTEVAEHQPRVRDDHTYFITGLDEIEQMRALLDRAAAVVLDPEIAAGIGRIRGYVEACARRAFVPSRLYRGWPAYGWLALVGLGGLTAVALAAPAALLGVVAGAIGLGWNARVPRWKLNLWAVRPKE